MTHAVTSYRHNGALGSSLPADVVLSADGSRIYTSGTDGTVRVYHADTGALLSTWTVGTSLGAMDLSPDGSFLLVVEAEPVSSFYAPGGNWPANQFTVAVHKVNTATGAVTTFLHQASGYEWAFHDVSILSDGTAMLTQKVIPGWSAWIYPEILNLQTGVFTSLSQSVRQSSFLSESDAGTAVLIGESNISDAPLRMYDRTSGFFAVHQLYQDGVSGFNSGVQALSVNGNLVAQFVPGNGLHIYNVNLNYQRDLTDVYTTWTNNISGLAFDPSGDSLFVLDAGADRIYEVSTSDWSILGSIAVGADLTSSLGGFGNRLLIGPSMRYFTVVTETGLLQVDNPNVSETITGTEEDDVLNGTGLHDVLEGLGGDDTLNGGGGDDEMIGGLGNDIYSVDSAADVVVENAGEGTDEIRTSLATYSLVGTEIENLSATNAIAHDFRGSAGNNVVTGGGANDLLRLDDGGDDTANGGAGNDLIYFGAAFTGADVADGGDGRDVLVLQGNYDLTLSDTSIANLESISIQSGARTTWGDTANNFYDYKVVTADANVPAGVQLIVNGQSLRVDEDFTFDGSAETDGRFLVYGGHGADDLTGGAGNDVFFFEGVRFQAGDSVDGGAGRDSIIISSGSGVNRFEFSDTSFTNIEAISVNNRFTSDPSQKPSYELILANGNVAAGQTLILNGSSLADPTQTVTFDGSAVEDGNLILFSGAGVDTLIGGDGADLFYAGGSRDHLTGGAGADTFQYRAVGDSLPWGESDIINDFEGGIDKIDLSFLDADITTPGDQAFTFIGSALFSNQAGELRVVDMGNNMWLIMADVDGDANEDFTTAADFMLSITRTDSSAMIVSDFIL